MNLVHRVCTECQAGYMLDSDNQTSMNVYYCPDCEKKKKRKRGRKPKKKQVADDAL